MSHYKLNRRHLLCGLMATTLTAPGLAATLTQAPGARGRKLVLVILRGAMDGLAALAPIADPRYAELRGGLALRGGAPVADGFVLHPSLSSLATAWSRGEALALHAAATPYRDRSHFDGQDVLETGAAEVGDLRDGWLNRALSVMAADAPDAVGIGPSLPLILRGDAPTATWSPPVLPEVDAGTISRLISLYETDPALSAALDAALETDLIVGGAGDVSRRGRITPTGLAAAAAQLMTASGGADLAVLELEGWDTHVNQGADTGTLANAFADLDEALETLRTGLGRSWTDSAVLVVTEFGRTARINGGGGTDHGSASVAFLLGGAVRGGRRIGAWPGLDALHEDRDLAPANDLRSLFKGVLAQHWGLSQTQLEQTVFPDSANAPPLEGLFR